MQTTAGRVLCEHVSVVGVSTSTPDTDESDEDWMDALAEAVDSMVGADSGDTPYVDGEYEIAPADKRFAGGVPKVIPPILKDMDSDSQRVKVLMQWLEDLPEGVASLNGVVVGVGKYGVGIFATEDLPPDHVALRINTSRVVTTTQCEAWANRYHSLGQVLAALEPRSLGDGRWSPRCSRATKLSIYLIAERALFMAHFNSSPAHDIPNELKQGHLSALNTAGSPETPRAKVSYVRSTAPPTVTGSNAPVGYVASLPGFGAMTPAVSVLRLKPGQTAHFSVGRHSLVGLGSGPSPQLSTEQDDSRRAEERLLQSAMQVQHYVETELQRGPFHRFFPSEVFSPKAIRWALGCVYSRGFNIDGHLVMVPLIDMMNHAAHKSSGHNTTVQYEDDCGKIRDAIHSEFQSPPRVAKRCLTSNTVMPSTSSERAGRPFSGGGSVIAKTTVAVRKGDEVLVCYNQWDSKAELFAKYGIVPDADK